MSLGNEFETDTKQKIPNKKSIIKILVILGAVIVVACAVVIGLNLKKSSDYDRAVELLDDLEYQEAAQIFTDLGDYKESQQYLLECDYLLAKDTLANGEYQDAAAMFETLGDYEDSKEKLAESQNHIKYIDAKELMDNENYAEAKAAFLELGDFLDSARMASKCKMADDYNQAVALMEAEDYEGAKQMFDELPYYKQSDQFALICAYKIMYMDAVQQYEDEQFVEAWRLLRDIKYDVKQNEMELSLVADEEKFDALKDECYQYVKYKNGTTYFENEEYYYAYTNFINTDVYDAAQMAQQCIQTFKGGVLYTNPDYLKKEATIIFRADSDRIRNAVFKVMDGKTLVAVVALKPGQRVTIKIPEGVYSIASGSGDMWFGDKNYFGGDGNYYKLHFPKDQSFAGMKDKILLWSFINTIIDIYAEGKTGNVTNVKLTYRQFLDLN